MSQKVLLLGGTGAMGTYLSQILQETGSRVTVTTRSARESMTPNLRYVQGNARDIAFVKRVVADEKPDAIVDFMAYGAGELHGKIDDLLNASGQYVFLSSYRVFANSPVLTERSPRLLDDCSDSVYVASNEYAIDKAREENLIRAYEKGNWTIVRPSITFSRERFQFGCLEANVVCYRAFQGLPVPICEGMLDKQTTLTWGRDAALLISRLIGNPKAIREDFNVVTSEHQTWREVARIYNEEIGLDVREVTLPDYERITMSPAQIKYDRMYNRILDNSKVLSATGLSQTDLTPLDVALRTELRAFKQSPRFERLDLVRNARIDRILRVRISCTGLPIKERLIYLRALYPELDVYTKGIRLACGIYHALGGGRR